MAELFQRLIYIDSEVNTIGNGEEVRIDLPAEPFTVGEKEKIKLVLNNFQMRRQFTNINRYNKYFYIQDTSSGVYTELQLQEGTYENFTDLAAAIKTALDSTFGGSSTVNYNSITRKLTITTAGTAPVLPNARMVFFQAKSGTPPANVNQLFQDTHEVFGGKRTSSPTNIVSGMRVVGGNYESFYPASLGSLEAIYIRINLANNNYQTYGYEKNLPDLPGLTPSQIFARIPLATNASTPNANNFIEYEDQNELFQIVLGQKTLDTISIRLTDDKNRPLPLFDPENTQALEGNLSFKMTLKFAVVDDTPSPMKTLERLLRNTQPNISQNPDLNLDYYVRR
jgi:hypothetical protein